MTGEFECDAAAVANALAHALGKIEVMAVAGRKVRAGLGDADDRLAGLSSAGVRPNSDSARDRARSFRGFWIVEPKL
jgi:hypothetical protein